MTVLLVFHILLCAHAGRDWDSLTGPSPSCPFETHTDSRTLVGCTLSVDGGSTTTCDLTTKTWDCCGPGNRAKCPAGHKACNELARNKKDFSCWHDCAEHGGDKPCPPPPQVKEEMPEWTKGKGAELKWTLRGTGVAGSPERWNVGDAKGKGVQKCYEAVIADKDCDKDYFTYAARGDGNCGCKGTGGTATIEELIVRPEADADYYHIEPMTGNRKYRCSIDLDELKKRLKGKDNDREVWRGVHNTLPELQKCLKEITLLRSEGIDAGENFQIS